MADIRGQGSDMEGPYSPDRAGASNMSIHVGPPGAPMDVRDHPARNVPNATQHYDGDVLNKMHSDMDMAQRISDEVPR